MTTAQKVIKYLAMAFAIFLTVSIIGGLLSLFGLFGGFFSDDAVTEDIKTYSVSADIKSLEIKINAADFTIKQGESFSVESNLKHLTVEDKNGVLTIKETKKYSKTYTGAVLTLYVPADTVFDRADIITGAGRFTVDQLSARTMKFELGAGEVTIDTLIATTAIDIDGLYASSTSAATVVSCSSTEMRSIFFMPHFPVISPFQKSGIVAPMDVTAPIPVITTFLIVSLRSE